MIIAVTSVGKDLKSAIDQRFGRTRFIIFYNFLKDIEKYANGEIEIHIVPTSKKIRDFILLKPYKIVIDFKRDASFYTKSVDIKKAPFEKITLGNHNGYYRAVLLLDGSYKYKLTKTLKGYLCEVY